MAGVGSPSLMMIMCLTAASWTPAKAVAAIFRAGSKAGMSPIVIRSVRGEHHLAIGSDANQPPLRLAPQPLIGAVPLDEAAIVATAQAS